MGKNPRRRLKLLLLTALVQNEPLDKTKELMEGEGGKGEINGFIYKFTISTTARRHRDDH